MMYRSRLLWAIQARTDRARNLDEDSLTPLIGCVAVIVGTTVPNHVLINNSMMNDGAAAVNDFFPVLQIGRPKPPLALA
jgi:hypothetical protein